MAPVGLFTGLALNSDLGFCWDFHMHILYLIFCLIGILFYFLHMLAFVRLLFFLDLVLVFRLRALSYSG